MKRILLFLLCFVLICGFTACAKSNAGSNTSQTNEHSDNTEEKNEESSADVLLTLDDGKLSILSIKGVDGPFVEKGERIEAENITSVVIRNNSNKMLEYGSLSFRVNKYERADFAISALPPGESAVVMETLARPFSGDDEYEIVQESVLTAYREAQSETEKVKVTAENGIISLTNFSDRTITANVIYKYYKNGMYYGGIAFSGSFENIKPGETVSRNSERFNEECRIVNLQIEEK